MTPVWKDGILTMLRAAQLGTELAVDPHEKQVVASLIMTALIAQGRVR